MKESGFDLTFGSHNLKCATVTTGSNPDGKFDCYISLLTGKGMQRHFHGYAEEIINGVLIKPGGRLKEEKDLHCGPGITLSHTTQEIARLRVEKDVGGPQTQLSQCINDKWFVTSPSTWKKEVKRRSVLLPGSQGAVGAEYSIALFDAKSSSSLPPTQ